MASSIVEAPSFMPTYTKLWHNKIYPTISPLRPENSAKNKVVIITGGGAGIGASIAKAFAEAGAKAIGIVGRRENLLKSSAETLSSISTSTKVDYAVADITDSTAVHNAFGKFASSLGKVDIIVHNAAYLANTGPIEDSELNDWWSGFEINVKGTYNVIRAFLPHASANSVFLGVNAGFATNSKGIPGMSSYVSSKIAAARLLECMQVEHPEIRIINVHPGVVETAMTGKLEKPGMDDPNLVSGLMVWLSSPEAAFLKGKFIWANHDVDELKERAVEIEAGSELNIGLLGLKLPGN